MAAVSSAKDPFSSAFYLSPSEQDLLAAALASNKPRSAVESHRPPSRRALTGVSASAGERFEADKASQALIKPAELEAPAIMAQSDALLGLDDFRYDDNSFLPYDFGLPSYDDLYYEPGKVLDGPLPDGEVKPDNGPVEHEGDSHDKRKVPDDDSNIKEGDAKRREGDEKTAKKPGRKPLMSEPTTKRKAQNRAAQRAFRERKEKHLRDLESKVEDLERASQSANEENGALRAQVSRLQEELREYRKRLALLGRSAIHVFTPVRASSNGSYGYGRRPGGATEINDFQFDFPKFGSLPGSHMFDNGSLVRQGSASQARASDILVKSSLQNTSPQVGATRKTSSRAESVNTAASSPFAPMDGSVALTKGGGRFGSPDIVDSSPPPPSWNDYFQNSKADGETGQDQRKSSQSSVGQRPYAPAGGAYMSSSASPSASSVSHQAPGSSTATTPASYHNSPTYGGSLDGPMNSISEELASGETAGEAALVKPSKPSSMSMAPSFDWLAQQNGGQFDPELFGNYREPQDAITSGDYGFFNDALPFFDFSTPLSEGLPPSPPLSTAVGTVAAAATTGTATAPAAAAAVATASATPAAISPDSANKRSSAVSTEQAERDAAREQLKVEVNCETLWNHIKDNEHFQKGEVDIEGLCDDMQKKARCSETGLHIDKDMVDHMLEKFAASNTNRAQD